MIRFIGRDMQGINRVWGDGETIDEAAAECEKAINEYVKRRPDCWPMQMVRQGGNIDRSGK